MHRAEPFILRLAGASHATIARMTRRTMPALAALLLALAGTGLASDQQTQAFVEALVAAINSKDTAQRKALVHPHSLRCGTAGSDQLLDEQFARQARRAVPANVTWSLTPAPPGQPLFADKFDYPVRPTHRLQLDFSTGPNRSTTMVLQVAQHGGAWREVRACPKPQTVAAAKAASQARAQHRQKVERLLKDLSPGVNDEVVALLEDGRRIDAIKAYRAASGEDLVTAKSVVDAIEEGLGR
jgi:ribosomal protein L7/L12